MKEAGEEEDDEAIKALIEESDEDFGDESDEFESDDDSDEDSEEETKKKPPTNKKTGPAAKGKKTAKKGDDSEDDESPKASKKRLRNGQPKKGKEDPKAKKGTGKGADKDGGKKMMSDKEALEAITEFMIRQNRPYGVQNVIDNLQGRIKKVQTQKIMDDLTDMKILTVKDYNKNRIYIANQDNFPVTSSEELAKLDKEIQDKKENLQKQQHKLKECQNCKHGGVPILWRLFFLYAFSNDC